MKFLHKTDWQTLALELVIVFVGLLAALQVDQWREEKNYYAAENRYLTRLGEDLDASIASSRDYLDFMKLHHEGVRHVNQSFSAGEILDGNSKLFEFGLIYVGHLPSVPIHRSAYDEMVASGMFARLRSEKLKRAVSGLYASHDLVERNFSWWRGQVLRLSNRLMNRVTYYSEGELTNSNPLLLNEPQRRVRFDFKDLHSDAEIRNEFYWADDTHSDWVEWTATLIEHAEDARTELNTLILTR